MFSCGILDVFLTMCKDKRTQRELVLILSSVGYLLQRYYKNNSDRFYFVVINKIYILLDVPPENNFDTIS